MGHANVVNNDYCHTDHHHHLMDNHGISGNVHFKIKYLIVCVKSVCPAMYADDGLSLHCANRQHAS